MSFVQILNTDVEKSTMQIFVNKNEIFQTLKFFLTTYYKKMICAVFYASELSLKKPQLISRNQNFSSVP